MTSASDEFAVALIEGRNDDAISLIPRLSDREWAVADAVSKGRLEVCKALIDDFGCDPNAGDEDELPLRLSIVFGFPDVCEFLLSRGADPNLDRDLVSAVNSDVPENALIIAKLLVSHGVDVNKTFAMFGDESNRRSALDFASKGSEVYEYLRSIGAKTAAEIHAE